jgi:hypothetical protein
MSACFLPFFILLHAFRDNGVRWSSKKRTAVYGCYEFWYGAMQIMDLGRFGTRGGGSQTALRADPVLGIGLVVLYVILDGLELPSELLDTGHNIPHS